MPALVTAFLFFLFDASIGWWILWALILVAQFLVFIY
jgi:hypothetical protein